MNILQTTDLKKYYGTEPNITKALDGVTLSIEKGEFVAIVGTSGSGKSTLLNMMGGLDTPTSGSIEVKGKELSKLKDEQLTIFRRRNIGFIFQNYNLVPVLNVYENIVKMLLIIQTRKKRFPILKRFSHYKHFKKELEIVLFLFFRRLVDAHSKAVCACLCKCL